MGLRLHYTCKLKFLNNMEIIPNNLDLRPNCKFFTFEEQYTGIATLAWVLYHQHVYKRQCLVFNKILMKVFSWIWTIYIIMSHMYFRNVILTISCICCLHLLGSCSSSEEEVNSFTRWNSIISSTWYSYWLWTYCSFSQEYV